MLKLNYINQNNFFQVKYILFKQRDYMFIPGTSTFSFNHKIAKDLYFYEAGARCSIEMK